MTIVNNSTSAFYERSLQGMSALRKRAESVQQQLGSGEKLSRSSDNPVAASRLRSISRDDTLSGIDLANANRASADLTLADSALSSFATYISRARELALQAATGTLTDDQRAGIGVEIEELHGNLVALANARDSAGHALFGGEASGLAYELDASGNAVYVGTGTSDELPLGQGQTVTRGVTGPDFLSFDVGGTPTELMEVIKTLGAALQGNGGDPVGAAKDALTALNAGLDAVTTTQTVVGSRLAWIDLTVERNTNLAELRASEEADIGATDIAATVAELQQLMVVLEASQASFARLSGLSLFEMVR